MEDALLKSEYLWVSGAPLWSLKVLQMLHSTTSAGMFCRLSENFVSHSQRFFRVLFLQILRVQAQIGKVMQFIHMVSGSCSTHLPRAFCSDCSLWCGRFLVVPRFISLRIKEATVLLGMIGTVKHWHRLCPNSMEPLKQKWKQTSVFTLKTLFP